MRFLILFFTLGAVSLTTQALLIRELLVVVHGTELVLGLALGAWLFWIAVGAAIGTALARRTARPAVHLRSWAAIGGLTPLAQIELLRRAHDLLGVTSGLVASWPQTLLVVLAASAPFCLMIGVTFPLGCALLPDRSSRGVARLYLAESAGAVAGGALFSFVLAGRADPMVVALIGGAALVAAAGRATTYAPRATAGIALILCALGPAAADADHRSRAAQLAALAPGQQVLETVDTPYEQVTITRLDDQLTIYGNGLPTATVPDPHETAAMAYQLLAQQPEPRRVLVLGNPATGLAHELARALDGRRDHPRASITFVFHDAAQVRAVSARAAEVGLGPPSERIETRIEDPRSFVERSRAAYDLIFIDAPEPTTVQANRLFTRELFAAAARALSKDGVLAFRLASASAYVGHEVSDLGASIRQALSAAFPDVLVTAGEANTYFGAHGPGRLTRDPREVLRRLAQYPDSAPHRASIALGYDSGSRARLEAAHAARRTARANTDDRPSSSAYASVIWDRVSVDVPRRESLLTRALDAAGRVGRPHVVGGLAGLVTLWAVARRARRRARVVVDAVAVMGATGWAAMTASMVLLLRYQSACGALYQRLAVMSGLFMVGVALGAFAYTRFAPAAARRTRPRLLPALLVLAHAAYLLAVAAALGGVAAAAPWARQAGFAALFVATGLFLGTTFPATAQVVMADGGAEGAGAAVSRAGGVVDAADHLGAALGAFTAGTILLPVMGSAATLTGTAALLATVALAWIAFGAKLPARRRA